MTSERTKEEIRDHYELEKRLADRLRKATREERLKLYPELYDELYRKVPFLKTNPVTVDRVYLGATVRLLKPFLKNDEVFLEIGAGNLAVTREIAPLVKKVIALDVSQEFASALGPPPKNVELILSNGISIPIEKESVDLAYSNQLMEHLHPDDAYEQLKGVVACLKKGGKYICNTPNGINGPHDVSQYFDAYPTGFHLKEYTNKELRDLFLKAGFTRVYSLTGVRGYVIPMPVLPLIWLEFVLASLPRKWQRKIGYSLPIKALLGIRLVGVK